MRFRARVIGEGTAEIPAYGSGDAEARLEKELSRALPSARIRIHSLRRLDPTPRIVESFAVEYAIEADLAVEGEDRESARRAAFVAARRALEGTRFARIAWRKAELTTTAPRGG
jgi:hypothetical protein